MKDTELIKLIQYYWEPQPDWAFTRGFLPDYPLSQLKNGCPSLTERAFFDFMKFGYEGEMTDFFVWF